jgi:hypothetical protein
MILHNSKSTERKKKILNILKPIATVLTRNIGRIALSNMIAVLASNLIQLESYISTYRDYINSLLKRYQ